MKTSQQRIESDLLKGRVIKTTIKSMLHYGINQIPDAIRRFRRKNGADSVITNYKIVLRNGRPTRVAEYVINMNFKKNMELMK